MEWLAQWTDWSLWASIATVLGFVGALAAWLWRKGRRAFSKPSPPPPASPHQTALIGLPDPVHVYGREGDVAAIRARLTAAPDRPLAPVNAGVVLAGQGGIGKTTLARHYVTRHAAEYDGVLWTRAATRQNLIDGLCAAAPALGLPLPPLPREAEAKAVATAIAARSAASGRPWLIVLDNLEDRADLEGLMPPGAHRLVTTRQGTGWTGWSVLETDVLGFATPDAPAVALLTAHVGRTDAPEDARALAQDLGGLPLALTVMGAYLRDQGLGFAEGRARLAEVLLLAPPNAGYPDSLMGAVRLSYDRLPDDARTLARLLSYWASEGLGPALLLDAPGGEGWGAVLDLIPDTVQALARDEARTRTAFTALAARSLITGTGEARSMHRLTAAVLRTMDAGELAPAAVALLAAVYPAGQRSPGHSPQFPLCARLTPHVQALLATGAAPNVAAWDFLLNQAGVYLGAIADDVGGLLLAHTNLAAKQARGLPESDRTIALAHATLGVAWRRLGNLEQAEVELTRALDLEARHRPGSADHAGTLDLLGGVMLDFACAGQRDRLERAIKLYQQALAIRRRLAGRHSDAVAQALNNLGAARNLQGRQRAAARLCRACLKIWRTILPPGDARLAYCALNVGAQLLEAGEATKAEPLLRKSLEILEAAFAAQPQHPGRRNCAGWLSSCLLVRARAGVNRGLREAEAKRLCDAYGFDYGERVAKALTYPLNP